MLNAFIEDIASVFGLDFLTVNGQLSDFHFGQVVIGVNSGWVENTEAFRAAEIHQSIRADECGISIVVAAC